MPCASAYLSSLEILSLLLSVILQLLLLVLISIIPFSSKLVISLDANTIDGIITGHNHHQVHHWVSDIPIIASIDQGFYANILYIPFKWSSAKQIYELYKTKVQIEGPLPICDKIFTGTKKCDVVKPSKIEEYLPLVNYKFHGVKIEKDNTLYSIHEKYDEQFETYQEQICDIVGTEEILEISENGDFYIGNIITEIQRRITGADISLIGYDFMKTSKTSFFYLNFYFMDIFYQTREHMFEKNRSIPHMSPRSYE